MPGRRQYVKYRNLRCGKQPHRRPPGAGALADVEPGIGSRPRQAERGAVEDLHQQAEGKDLPAVRMPGQLQVKQTGRFRGHDRLVLQQHRVQTRRQATE